MSTSSKSIRVQLDENEKKQLEEIVKPFVKSFDLLYDDKISYTKILKYIALGKLQVTAPVIAKQNKDNKNSMTIKLDIEAPFFLAGVIYLITNAISDLKGNIITIKTKDDGNRNGNLQLLLEVDNSVEIFKILNSLDRLLLEDLRQFKYNNETRMKEAIDAYDGQKRKRQWEDDRKCKYNQKFAEGNEPKSDKKLIFNKRCTIPIRVITANQPGIVCEITKKIADNNRFISDIQQKLNGGNEETAFINLYLFFHPNSVKEAQNGLNNIDIIRDEIKDINGILAVEDLDIQELDT